MNKRCKKCGKINVLPESSDEGFVFCDFCSSMIEISASNNSIDFDTSIHLPNGGGVLQRSLYDAHQCPITNKTNPPPIPPLPGIISTAPSFAAKPTKKLEELKEFQREVEHQQLLKSIQQKIKRKELMSYPFVKIRNGFIRTLNWFKTGTPSLERHTKIQWW